MQDAPRAEILGVREGSGDRIVTLDELARRPDPQPMGRNHMPVRYDEAVTRVYDSLNAMNFDIGDSKFALCRKESTLMGLIQIGFDEIEGLRVAKLLGLRMSEVQATGFKLVAGLHVFLCTNLSLSAEDVLVNCKQTKNANIRDAIVGGIASFMLSATNFNGRMKRLAETSISDQEAKARMCDIATTVVAPNYLKDAYDSYFGVYDKEGELVTPVTEDCVPRSLWGLHNSWTRALRKTHGVNKVDHTQRLGSYFNA